MRDIKVMLKLLFKGADITRAHTHTHHLLTHHSHLQSHIQIYAEKQLFQDLRENKEATTTKFILWIYLRQCLEFSISFH